MENKEKLMEKIDGEIDEFIAELCEKYGIVFNDFNEMLEFVHDWCFKEEE